jgi:nitric oxide reductase subunit B
MWSFWLMTSSMCFMTFTLTFAGVVQTHLQRVMGMNYMEVQAQLELFYYMRLGAGVVVAVAAVVYLISIFGPIREQAPAGLEGQLAGATG